MYNPKLNLTKDQLKRYQKEAEILYDAYYVKLCKLERLMADETGIEDIEFFWVDNEIVGIGNASRTMKLIQFN